MRFKEGHYIKVYWRNKKQNNKSGVFRIVVDKNAGNIMNFVNDVIKPDNDNIIYEPVEMNFSRCKNDEYGPLRDGERKVIYDIDEISKYPKNETYSAYQVHYFIKTYFRYDEYDRDMYLCVITKSIETAIDSFKEYVLKNNKEKAEYLSGNVELLSRNNIYIADVLEENKEYKISFPSQENLSVYVSRNEKFDNHHCWIVVDGKHGSVDQEYFIIAKNMKDAIDIHNNFYNRKSSDVDNVYGNGSADDSFICI
jgi:hypothetical protein